VEEDNIFETEVPGAFELPLAARFLALTGTVDAIVCAGVLIKGEVSTISALHCIAVHSILLGYYCDCFETILSTWMCVCMCQVAFSPIYVCLFLYFHLVMMYCICVIDSSF
jgi:hypothetical protein